MPGACGVAERVQLMTEGRNFRGVAIFASLKMTALRKVALAMEELAYEAGDAIVQRGDEGDAMYFVRSGSCSIDLGEGVPAPPDLTAGDFFGELSLLTEERRSATIVANDAVQALRQHPVRARAPVPPALQMTLPPIARPQRRARPPASRPPHRTPTPRPRTARAAPATWAR